MYYECFLFTERAQNRRWGFSDNDTCKCAGMNSVCKGKRKKKRTQRRAIVSWKQHDQMKIRRSTRMSVYRVQKLLAVFLLSFPSPKLSTQPSIYQWDVRPPRQSSILVESAALSPISRRRVFELQSKPLARTLVPSWILTSPEPGFNLPDSRTAAAATIANLIIWSDINPPPPRAHHSHPQYCVSTTASVTFMCVSASTHWLSSPTTFFFCQSHCTYNIHSHTSLSLSLSPPLPCPPPPAQPATPSSYQVQKRPPPMLIKLECKWCWADFISSFSSSTPSFSIRMAPCSTSLSLSLCRPKHHRRWWWWWSSSSW